MTTHRDGSTANVLAILERDRGTRAQLARELPDQFGLDTLVHGPNGWLLGFRSVGGSIPAMEDDGVLAEVPVVGRWSEVATQTLLDKIRNGSGSDLASTTGDFTGLAVRADGSLMAVKAPSGQAPVYWWSSAQRTVVTTRNTWLMSLVPNAQPDWMTFAAFTSGWPTFPDQRAFVSGARVVLPGQRLRVAPDGSASLKTWWNPWMSHDDEYSDISEHELDEIVRSEVLNHLRQQSTQSPNLMSLSGGLDSSILVALAANVLEHSVHTVSVVVGGRAGNEHFRRIVETTRLARIASASLIEAKPGASVPFDREADQVGIPTFSAMLNALPVLTDQTRISTYGGGELADDVFGGEVVFPDWAREKSFWRTLQTSRNPHGVRDVARWIKHRFGPTALAPIPQPPRLSDAFAADLQAEWRDWWTRTADEMAEMPSQRRALRKMFPLHHAFGALNWEHCSERDVIRITPYVTRGLVELSARLHPDRLMGPGHKRPLRRAFRGLVPDEILARPKRVRSNWDGASTSVPVAAPARESLEALSSVIDVEAIGSEVTARTRLLLDTLLRTRRAYDSPRTPVVR